MVRSLYLFGPNLKYVGGWEGKPLPDICAEKSGGASAHWAKNPEECERIIEMAVYAVAIVVQYAVVTLAFYYLVRWTFTPRAAPNVVLNVGNSPAAAPAPKMPNPVAVAAGVRGAAKRASNAQKIAVYETWMRTCAHWAVTTPEKSLGEFFKLNPLPVLLNAASGQTGGAGSMPVQALVADASRGRRGSVNS